MLETATIDAFKGHITSAIDASGSAKKHRRLAVALIRELLVDLPDQFRMTLAEDGDFLGRLGISLMPAMPLGRHEINPQELWNAAARILTTKEPTLIDAKGGKLKILLLEQRGQQQIVVEDTAARMRYIVPADTVGNSVGFCLRKGGAVAVESRSCSISEVLPPLTQSPVWPPLPTQRLELWRCHGCRTTAFTTSTWISDGNLRSANRWESKIAFQ